MPPGWIDAAGWLLLAFWTVHLVPLWPLCWRNWLSRRAAGLPDPVNWPRVTVIVPARDEQSAIEQALRSVLALDNPAFEVIAVNDRSSDQTGPIMDRLSRENPRLRVIHVQELPPGWMGKNHALWSAERAAAGEWLLFTDADVLFDCNTLALAMRYVLAQKLDHLTLMPNMVSGGYWEDAMKAGFGFLFFAAMRPWLINTRLRVFYMGVGAFNLVRRETYRAVGGLARIRLNVVDDMHLARLIKQSGFSQHLLFAGKLISLRWHESLWGVIRGLEKNAFASVHYSLVKLCVVSVVLVCLLFGPYAGVPLTGGTGWPFWATLAMMHATYAFTAASFGGRFAVLPALPVTGFLLLFTLWRSALIALRQGGIRWRETFYSLAELRQNQW
jgi:hypothetical protein